MKALLLKDIYNLKKQNKLILGIVILYGFIGLFLEANFLSPLLIILCLLLPINTFSFDKYSKWDNYALTLPLTRSQIAISKYLMGFCLVLLGVIVNSLFYFLTYLMPGSHPITITLHLLSCYIMIFVALLCFSILFPFIFKLGIEKSRIIMIVIFLIPSLSFALFPKLGYSIENTFKLQMQYSFTVLMLASFLLLLGIVTLSICISVRILNNKDF